VSCSCCAHASSCQRTRSTIAAALSPPLRYHRRSARSPCRPCRARRWVL